MMAAVQGANRTNVHEHAEERSSVHERTMLLTLMLIYGAASLLHFAHNAVYLRAYPNLPAWLTPAGVGASWLIVALVGALGYVLYVRISRAAGLAVIALYAALGFAGLDHYAVAAVSAHTIAMNLTILLEVVAAGALLVFIALANRLKLE
jgi:hypothetical protein